MNGPFQFYHAKPQLEPGVTRDDMIASIMNAGKLSLAAAERAFVMSFEDAQIFKSSKYQVSVFDNPPNGFSEPMIHLSIKRLDREPIHDWRDLQRIKNALVGEECEAIEIYPAESRLVDSANQYHLWCFTNPTVRIPVGFTVRLVDDASVAGSKNRPFDCVLCGQRIDDGKPCGCGARPVERPADRLLSALIDIRDSTAYDVAAKARAAMAIEDFTGVRNASPSSSSVSGNAVDLAGDAGSHGSSDPVRGTTAETVASLDSLYESLSTMVDGAADRWVNKVTAEWPRISETLSDALMDRIAQVIVDNDRRLM